MKKRHQPGCPCCEPPTPPCVSCPSKIFFCHPDPCGICRLINSFTFEIDGSTTNPTWGACHCDDINGSYNVPLIYESNIFSKTFTAYDGACATTYPGSTHGRSLTVSGIWYHTDTDIITTAGAGLPSEFSGLFPGTPPACSTLTISPGHYVMVTVNDEFSYGYNTIPGVGYVLVQGYRRLLYVKGMNNGEEIENCPTEDKYGLCSGISTGEMTLIGSYIYRYATFPLYNCTDYTDYPLCLIPTVELTAVDIDPGLCEEAETPP